MRKIKEILRLKWIGGSSTRQIAKSCNISRSTVQEYLNRAVYVWDVHKKLRNLLK